MGKYVTISGADFSQVAVEKLEHEYVITDFDISKIKNVRYAGGNNNGLFYYTLAQQPLAEENISYIIPYKLEVGSTVTIKFKETAKSAGGMFGALHDFSRVPSNLSPEELLDADFGQYANLKKGTEAPYQYEFTYTIREGFPYIELYFFSGTTYEPSEIYDAIEYISVVRS